MIWQERPHIIVMVTNLNEGHKSKCEKYWPSYNDSGCDATATYDAFHVTTVEEILEHDLTTRTITVKVQKHSVKGGASLSIVYKYVHMHICYNSCMFK